MKRKGDRLPSITIEGSSDAVTVFRDGRIVKVCPFCEEVLDRSSGLCPQGHPPR